MQWYFAPAAIGLAILPGVATARPADCSLIVEGKPVIDGSCDFTAEKDGSFAISAGSIKANVMVDPGSRTGRAFYEDSSPRGGSWVIGDVNRDGACWANKVGRLCAWDPGARPRSAATSGPAVAQAAAPTPAPGAAPVAPPPAPAATTAETPWGQKGPWLVTVQTNANGFVNCRAARPITNGDLRFSLNADLAMAMSAPVGAPAAQRVPVKLMAGSETDSVQGAINAEGRLIVSIAPPLGREMVEKAPKDIRVESPAGSASFPIDPFRPAWDELNTCVEARGKITAGSTQGSLPVPASAQAPKPQKLDTGFYRTEYARPGDWIVIRFSSNKDVLCTALKTRESDLMVRFSFDAAHKEFSFGLSAPRPEGSETKAKLTTWFNGDKKAATTDDADHLLDVDGGEYLSVTKSNVTPSAGDAFLDKDNVSFLYKFEKADRTETFPLAGIKPAFAQMFACATGK